MLVAIRVGGTLSEFAAWLIGIRFNASRPRCAQEEVGGGHQQEMDGGGPAGVQMEGDPGQAEDLLE